MSRVIVSCAIGGVTDVRAISVLVVVRMLAMRNASANIGFGTYDKLCLHL